MDHTHRFDGKGELYDKARPCYAAGLLDFLKDGLGLAAGCVGADVGSGTGIFTGQLLESGYRVFAVEPNGDMRRKAEEKLSGRRGFVSLGGSAAHTGLPDRSVDFVTAAQAFHWFDAQAFRTECKRILRPGGWVVLIYNVRDEQAPCTRALAELRRATNPAFPGFSNGLRKESCAAFFEGSCRIFRADNTPLYDRQSYCDRALSSSYSLKEGDARYADYRAALEAIFDRFSVGGVLAVPTRTVAFAGTV